MHKEALLKKHHHGLVYFDAFFLLQHSIKTDLNKMMNKLNVNSGCIMKRWQPLDNRSAVTLIDISDLVRPLSSFSAVLEIEADIWHLPSHLFGRWTHSSSPPSLAAPTDQIITKNDASPATNMFLLLPEFLPAFKSLLVLKTRIKIGYISVSTCFSLPTAVKATNKSLPPWRNALQAVDQSEKEKWQALDQWDSGKGRGRQKEEVNHANEDLKIKA